MDLHLLQQSILGVCFLWPPNSNPQLLICLITAINNSWGMISTIGMFWKMQSRNSARAVTQSSFKSEIGGHKGIHSIGCCNDCKIQSIGLDVIFRTWSTSIEITISLVFVIGFQWMNERSKCAEIICSLFDNLHYPRENVNFEIWLLKATVWKLLLSSIEPLCNRGTFSMPLYHLLLLHTI